MVQTNRIPTQNIQNYGLKTPKEAFQNAPNTSGIFSVLCKVTKAITHIDYSNKDEGMTANVYDVNNGHTSSQKYVSYPNIFPDQGFF